ncbi:MAG: uroporphyrinogen-III synthase [Thermoleophilia bacterium]
MRVLVTRAAGQAGRLSERLRAAGLEVVECPLVETVPTGDDPVDVSGYDWVVLTSRTGVEELVRRAVGPLPPVAVIGPGTAAALRAHGVEPALVPARSTQEGLLAELPRPAGRVLFAGAQDARPLLAGQLAADVVVLYRTVPRALDRLPDADVAALASASAARALAAHTRDLPCVSIGPQTSAAARAAGLTVVQEAERSDLDGLVQAVRLVASRLRSSPS